MLTDEQRKLLIDAYDGGLTSTGKCHASEIANLAVLVGVSEETIKNFIGYHRSNVGGNKLPRKVRSYVKGCSGYNVFCKTMGTNDSMKDWGQKWSALSELEKKSYQTQAKSINSSSSIDDLSDRQRKAAIKGCILSIYKQIEQLERLNVEAICLVADSTNGAIKSACSKVGEEYLKHSNTLNDFSCHVRANVHASSVQLRESEPDYATIRKQVQDLLNKKYSEAVGKQNVQMPYTAVATGMVLVHGIPEECRPLKTPGTYGILKLKAISAAASAIRVELLDVQTSTSSVALGVSSSFPTGSTSAIDLLASSAPCTSTANFLEASHSHSQDKQLESDDANHSSLIHPPESSAAVYSQSECGPLLSTLINLLKSVVPNPATTQALPADVTVSSQKAVTLKPPLSVISTSQTTQALPADVTVSSQKAVTLKPPLSVISTSQTTQALPAEVTVSSQKAVTLKSPLSVISTSQTTQALPAEVTVSSQKAVTLKSPLSVISTSQTTQALPAEVTVSSQKAVTLKSPMSVISTSQTTQALPAEVTVSSQKAVTLKSPLSVISTSQTTQALPAEVTVSSQKAVTLKSPMSVISTSQTTQALPAEVTVSSQKAVTLKSPLSVISTSQTTQALPAEVTVSSQKAVTLKSPMSDLSTTEDTTPCCVCQRQHNQPPFQDWFVCIIQWLKYNLEGGGTL